MTGGLFDVTLGALTGRDAGENTGRGELRGCLQLNPDRPEIACLEAGRVLDLGGIGKGHALDRMAETLRDLGVSGALLSAGASTHLAMGEAVWPMELKAAGETRTMMLCGGMALSASGSGVQGDHIVHPGRDVGEFPPRAWVVASTGALSDALSTACFVAREEERRGFQREIPELLGIFIESRDGLIMPVEGNHIHLADRE